MIFEKKGMWKSTHGADKFATEQEAIDWEIENGHRPLNSVDTTSWSPLEKLRGWSSEEEEDFSCELCECDPCECDVDGDQP